MFTTMFWILAIWFIINVIRMWFVTDNQKLQKTFAWINVVAVIVGFWVYFGATKVSGIDTWFNIMNYANIVVALVQFYFGYRNSTTIKHA
ncbi:hypothetical protein [Companilactobacillus bobalius]|uniref:Uncharacterized protein n=2 Tax=Companilactobacillus bobalius TaxID=2801451 RepID=A0A202F8C6_9LACO|nr:hypothetical protein [Companilactobacillus bobalius]GEO58962.1 hypothetical protein LBO01_20910 [Companilactobacillus paralimentarius]KAE9559515.1 hypothetical protein ATN92_11600 [Companilactobacillus bobalius]KAE9563957.1 hypothetical protein ATN92_01945 [Companilactobacillus bobalius]KRK83615.1 hypothetical protein FC78_GL001572 [Companilactobacillus bobalius DSM 19674]OVE96698.1 hypothetical protein LKACC16343_02367 [Companilactobacillus bobalius]